MSGTKTNHRGFLFCALCLCASVVFSSAAPTFRLATNASRASIEFWATNAAKGDVIYIPGTNTVSTIIASNISTHTWTNLLTITNCLFWVSEKGKIADALASGAGPILEFEYVTTTRGPSRWSGFYFEDGGRTTEGSSGVITPKLGSASNLDTNLWMRIDHNTFYYLDGNTITSYDYIGTIDTNEFYVTPNQQATYHRHNWWNGGNNQNCCGHGSWATDVDWDSDRFGVIMEMNTFIGTAGTKFWSTDGSSAARAINRYSTLTNGYPVISGNHGLDTGGPRRGFRAYAAYELLCYGEPGTALGIVADTRGGEVVFHDITITNYLSGSEKFSVDYHRFHGGFVYYGGADGTNPVDSVDTTGTISVGSGVNAFATGVVASVGTKTLGVTDGSLSSQSWTNYTVRRLTDIVGMEQFAYISASTSTSITWIGSFNRDDLAFTVGEPFRIHKVKFGLDMPGQGKNLTAWTNDASSNPIPPASWSTNQDQLNPGIWEWDNGNASGLNVSFNVALDVYQIQLWTNVFNDSVKPGYTDLTFPHPLVTQMDSYVITPATATVSPGGALDLDGAGGSGTNLIYHVWVNNSGALIDPITGVYTAGTTNGVTDTVRSWDTWGNYKDAIVSVSVTSTPGGPPSTKRRKYRP